MSDHLPSCRHRHQLSAAGEIFRCDHPRIFSGDGLVDAAICRTCRYCDADGERERGSQPAPRDSVETDGLCFYEAFYLQQHPQVREDILEGRFPCGEAHFRAVGHALGLLHRWVDPRRLDETAYRLRYPDVDAAIRAGEVASAAEHWMRVGNREERWFFLRAHGRDRKLVVFVACSDFANVMTQWAQAIREHSTRLDAASVCLRPHKFAYELAHDLDLTQHPGTPGRKQLLTDTVTAGRLAAVQSCLESADFVVQADELKSHHVFELFKTLTGFDLLAKVPQERVAIYHGGTEFRRDSRNRNERDAGFLAQLTHPDLYRLAGANARPAFPVLESIPRADEVRERFRGDRLILLHTPSNPAVKGTATIRRVIQRVVAALPGRTIEYREITGVPNREVLDHKRRAHIHIDQFNDLEDRGVGGIGVSTFEAWRAGNLVLSSVNHILPAAWQAWGIDPERLPLVNLGTNADVFFERLLALCRQPNDDLAELAVQQGRAAYASFSAPKVAHFFEELFRVQDVRRIEVPAVRRRIDNAVIVVPFWPSPGHFHKQRYAEMLAFAFDAEVLAIKSEKGLYERVMAEKPRLVITMNLPLYNHYSDRLIHQLPRSVKLVTWHDDLRRQMHKNLPAVLDRSDAVISVLRQAVLCADQFPGVADRLWRIPWFVPATIPPYALNRRPLGRCLLPGALLAERLIRRRAVREVPADLLERLEHPGYGKASYAGAVVGKDFYDLIHAHACCLTDAGIYRYVVAKYVEVPYTGSLLLAQDVPDLEEMGYRAGRHFLAVDEHTDLQALIKDVLANLDDYQAVREAGQRLVMERHTERVRVAEARQVALDIRQHLGLENQRIPRNALAARNRPG